MDCFWDSGVSACGYFLCRFVWVEGICSVLLQPGFVGFQKGPTSVGARVVRVPEGLHDRIPEH